MLFARKMRMEFVLELETSEQAALLNVRHHPLVLIDRKSSFRSCMEQKNKYEFGAEEIKEIESLINRIC